MENICKKLANTFRVKQINKFQIFIKEDTSHSMPNPLDEHPISHKKKFIIIDCTTYSVCLFSTSLCSFLITTIELSWN